MNPSFDSVITPINGDISRSDGVLALKSLLLKPKPKSNEQSKIHEDLTALKQLLMKSPARMLKENSETKYIQGSLPCKLDSELNESKFSMEHRSAHTEKNEIALKKILFGPSMSQGMNTTKLDDTSPNLKSASSEGGQFVTEDKLRSGNILALKTLLKSAKPSEESGVHDCKPVAKKVKKSSPSRRQSPSNQSLQTSPPPSRPESNVTITPTVKLHKGFSGNGVESTPDFDARRSTFYAGSSFMNSPCPEAIPLPDFDERFFDSNSTDALGDLHFGITECTEHIASKTVSLRRLLKL
mmetsp:Transcript_11398/g.11427  ORF Transcript_11398/g.11427 Transcript_11398/m.11427 type:complete len:297 (-) Transcript_11398:395-1285(-)|eukprot:CAMPEP_0182416276 /NCGR_PEP_ID=MMETSP1167-20130531/549_1 /TAXON_ID=2988 /ORGANISM="Mallomonas Sp, Strain CCMP3275" /LENGTH=296 /DNA_ID=CAMNT_0024588907 /DNA_START=167 /DNA_END=1060 /DNA_ORIENTATION=-